MKKFFLLAAFAFIAIHIEAQIFRVHLKDGSTYSYAVDQIDYIDFVEQEGNSQPGTGTETGPVTHSTEPYFSETVELMGLLWRLAGSQEYCQCDVSSISRSVDTYFASMTNHEAVTLARQYSQQGIVYDAVTGYANQLIFDRDGSIIFDPDYQEGSNTSFDRWSRQQKNDMLSALNDFYKKSNFHDWFVSTTQEQQQAIASFKTSCNLDYTWFDTFYGKNEKIASRIILSFLLGPNNNGISLTRNDGTFLLTPTLGSLFQSGNSIRFGGDVNLVVHEFSHPYCNPLIEKNWSSISKKAEDVFSRVSSIMQSQAYGNARTMMCETLVRACAISYMKSHGQANQVNQRIAYEEGNGFMLVRTVVKALDNRIGQEAKYPTLEDFMPEIIDAINNFEKEDPSVPGGSDPVVEEPTDHDYVDLGIELGDGRKLYFATMNVGETSVEGVGSTVYRWGATEEWGAEWNNPDDVYAFWPEHHKLDKEHDLCSIEWGGDWKTPSDDEWMALLDQCDYAYTDASSSGYGIPGYYFYNKADHSKNIFLPSVEWADREFWYWTSVIYGNNMSVDIAHIFNSWVDDNNQDRITLGTAGITSQGFRYRPVIKTSGAVNANGHDYVDLGITVDGENLYFSTMDIGATKVGERGVGCCWGATELYGSPWENPEKSIYGWPAGKRLDAAHDIATIKWGAQWHTPSVEEWNLLIEQCDWERKEASECKYGVTGYFFYKKGDHDTYIFLPAASWSNEIEYWTSEISQPYNGYISARTFNSYDGQVGTLGTAGISSTGFAVRPVFVK